MSLTTAQVRHLRICFNDKELVIGGEDATPNISRLVCRNLIARGLIKSVIPVNWNSKFRYILTDEGLDFLASHK